MRLAIQHRMVAGRVLISDSTHLKANANKRKFKKHVIEKTSRAYLKDLEVAINEDREVHGKKD